MTKSMLICLALLTWAFLGHKLIARFVEKPGHIHLKNGGQLTKEANPTAFKFWVYLFKLILVYGPIMGVIEIAIRWMVQASPPF